MDKVEKWTDREIAWRIFAKEFHMSTLFVGEGIERTPNYIITPTGVKCNRLFIVGVITEVENIRKDNNLWKARIADPTGIFTVYAGQYQAEAASYLSELEVPAYASIVGKARKYEPEDGSTYLSVRPEEINTANEEQRDRWVLDTTQRTFERIMIMEEALNKKLTGNELQEFLEKKSNNAAFVKGSMLAIKHYKNLDNIILDLKETLVRALDTITSEICGKEISQPPVSEETNRMNEMENHPAEDFTEDLKQNPPEPKEVIAGIIEMLDTGKGVSFLKVIETAQASGVDEETVETSIKRLMEEGRCYEPKIGMIRKA